MNFNIYVKVNFLQFCIVKRLFIVNFVRIGEGVPYKDNRLLEFQSLCVFLWTNRTNIPTSLILNVLRQRVYNVTRGDNPSHPAIVIPLLPATQES